MVLHNVYFSGKGTTKACADCIASEMGMEVNEYNWLTPAAVQEKIQIPAGEALLFSMPVYGGFIPHICAELVSTLEGNHTPAVIAAVYGNRHYDDALVQMRDLLEKQGFIVIAAGAFLAEHSIFTTVAAGRPDEDDRAAMKEFAGRGRGPLGQRELWEDKKIQVPGKTAYDPSAFKGVPFHPDGDEKCVGCGKYVQVCPQGAISRENPRETDGALCISCGACIAVCPEKARDYHGEAYLAARAGFEKKCAQYRKPEMYYIAEWE